MNDTDTVETRTAVGGSRLKRFVMWLNQRLCPHQFALEDLEKTGIPEPATPIGNDYTEWLRYHETLMDSDWHMKRVRWPCAKCGKVFYAHCGLDISPAHGPAFRRKPHNSVLGRIANTGHIHYWSFVSTSGNTSLPDTSSSLFSNPNSKATEYGIHQRLCAGSHFPPCYLTFVRNWVS